mmetsp:Transcript_98043/g.120073  ORF Transcript_98043/g.120073 Transcript_98043/m.120073 type:complete len:251 (-) Transcript_98043:397-1149(-)
MCLLLLCAEFRWHVFLDARCESATVGTTVCSFGQGKNLSEPASQEFPLRSADNTLIGNQLMPIQCIEGLYVLTNCIEQYLDVLHQLKFTLSRIHVLIGLVAPPVWQTQSLSRINHDQRLTATGYHRQAALEALNGQDNIEVLIKVTQLLNVWSIEIPLSGLAHGVQDRPKLECGPGCKFILWKSNNEHNVEVHGNPLVRLWSDHHEAVKRSAALPECNAAVPFCRIISTNLLMDCHWRKCIMKEIVRSLF